MMSKLPVDVVKGILYFMHELGKSVFPANIPAIHEAFYKISRDTKYEDLFSEFIFDEDFTYPYSGHVRSSLLALQSGGFLTCLNPELVKFQITNSFSDEDIKEFDDEDRALLMEVAQKFYDEMECREVVSQY